MAWLKHKKMANKKPGKWFKKKAVEQEEPVILPVYALRMTHWWHRIIRLRHR